MSKFLEIHFYMRKFLEIHFYEEIFRGPLLYEDSPVLKLPVPVEVYHTHLRPLQTHVYVLRSIMATNAWYFFEGM